MRVASVICYIERPILSPGSEKDITEVSGTSSPGSTPGRGTLTTFFEIERLLNR